MSMSRFFQIIALLTILLTTFTPVLVRAQEAALIATPAAVPGLNVTLNEAALEFPTGIVVTCQNERSQIQNRETAMKILRARLLEKKLNEEADERTRIKGDHTAAGFGNRIRSYVLHPYTQVTDHRTDTSVGDIQSVLDGGIDPFIDAYLHQQLTRTSAS